MLQTHRSAQGGSDEHLEGHQSADRVAGECDDRGARRGSPRALRHPRLHRDLDELDAATAVGAEGVLDHLVGPGADATGGDDQIGPTRV